MPFKFFLIAVCLFSAYAVSAQKDKARSKKTEQHIDQNVCNTLSAIAGYAQANFVDIKGAELEGTSAGSHHISLSGVAGAITSTIVNDSAGWRFEAVFYQGTSVKELGDFYSELAAHLQHCLPGIGYKFAERANNHTGLEKHPDLIYRNGTTGITVELKAAYVEMNGVYSAMLFVSR